MKLEILVGMIASGKSTYARHRADEGALVICHDDLTEMLHKRYRYEADLRTCYRNAMLSVAHHAMCTGRDVVVDRTNLTRVARLEWLIFGREWAADTGMSVRILAVVFPVDTPDVHASRRNLSDNRGRSRLEWLDVAKHHAGQMAEQPVSLAEGFGGIQPVIVEEIQRWAAEPNPFPAYLPPRA